MTHASQNLDTKTRLFWQGYKNAISGLGVGYDTVKPALYKRAIKNSRAKYDPIAYAFKGGELSHITSRNYEKSLRNIWKAEVKAPYLGFKDATTYEKLELQHSEESKETKQLAEIATSKSVLEEFNNYYTPEQQRALGRMISVIGHGEAYALFTSANILSVVKGTGARVGMAMQVMEEAKHFLVLRKMLQTLGIAQEPTPTMYLLFERIAKAPPYRMMFGMNIVLESLATSIFSAFSEAPGLRHIMHPFHMDEARHVGFVRSYSATDNLPKWVTESKREQIGRTALILPTLPAIWEYKDDLDLLGIDAFEFFGSTLHKISNLAEETGFPLSLDTNVFLALLNRLFNNYRFSFEPEKFDGIRDYTKVGNSIHIPDELLAVERKLFGEGMYEKAS